MNYMFLIGFILVIACMLFISVQAGKKVHSSRDFAGQGSKNSTLMVCGGIMGALVGSQTSLGTVQLAFYFGMAAWWFTLGAGLGCLVLFLFYIKPLRKKKSLTITGMIAEDYGKRIGSISSVLSSLGTYISIIVQIISCAGIVTVIFPGLTMLTAIILSMAMMSLYLVFGGAVSINAIGAVKSVMLYGVLLLGMFAVIWHFGGFISIGEQLEKVLLQGGLGQIRAGIGYPVIKDHADVVSSYYSLHARGPNSGPGAALSMILGVVSTQTYAQTVICARSYKEARRGTLICAAVIPPMGIAGILIGLYMRIYYITAQEAALMTSVGYPTGEFTIIQSAVQALPVYIMDAFPPIVAGMAIAALIVTVVSAGAGLTLGMDTTIYNDLYKTFLGSHGEKRDLRIFRMLVVITFVLGGVLAYFLQQGLINDLGFLSMGLRGSVIFVPLGISLFFHRKPHTGSVKLSVIAAPIVLILGKMMHLSINPLFLAIGVAIIICLTGKIFSKNSVSEL